MNEDYYDALKNLLRVHFSLSLILIKAILQEVEDKEEEEGEEEKEVQKEDNLIMIKNHKMKKGHKRSKDAILAKGAIMKRKIVGSKANLNVTIAKHLDT